MTSILRDWVAGLPLRHQGVLLAAVRGCDGAPPENSAKPLVRALRYRTLRPFDEREVDRLRGFFKRSLERADVLAFAADWDRYPLHFARHLLAACQVVGYKHPDSPVRVDFGFAYHLLVLQLHLMPEPEWRMDERLTEDRTRHLGDYGLDLLGAAP